MEEYNYQGDRALDYKIATELMGWNPKDNTKYFWFKTTNTDFSELAEIVWGSVGGYSGPEFTNSIEAAWMALDKVRTIQYGPDDIELEIQIEIACGWITVDINGVENDSQYGGINVINRWSAHHRNVPMAISLAIEKYLDSKDK